MPTNILRDASEVDPALPVSETVGKIELKENFEIKDQGTSQLCSDAAFLIRAAGHIFFCAAFFFFEVGRLIV